MASKGGKGKEKQVKSPPQVEPEKPPEREIVPGKITESQWSAMLVDNILIFVQHG